VTACDKINEYRDVIEAALKDGFVSIHLPDGSRAARALKNAMKPRPSCTLLSRTADASSAIFASSAAQHSEAFSDAWAGARQAIDTSVAHNKIADKIAERKASRPRDMTASYAATSALPALQMRPSKSTPTHKVQPNINLLATQTMPARYHLCRIVICCAFPNRQMAHQHSAIAEPWQSSLQGSAPALIPASCLGWLFSQFQLC
jgi:hypothetical protein